MTKYICLVCGYEYLPQKGEAEEDIPPGTDFQNLPDDWHCPECGAGRDNFTPFTTDAD